MLREREAKEACDATIADIRAELINKNEEIEKMKVELDQVNMTIEQVSSLKKSGN